AVAVLVWAPGPFPAEQGRPAPQINKLTIYKGSTKTVTYIVQGGSPRLRARVRALQYVENEVTLVEQLQQLKMDYVANERLLEGLRTSGSVANRSFPGRESSIKRALADTL